MYQGSAQGHSGASIAQTGACLALQEFFQWINVLSIWAIVDAQLSQSQMLCVPGHLASA